MPDRQMVYIPPVWLKHIVGGRLIYLLSWRANGCGPCISKRSLKSDLLMS